jgi:hypothetical protein
VYIISCIHTELEIIGVEKQIFKKFRLFSTLSVKIGQNSAATLSGRSTYYSALFELCGRTISQLATMVAQQGAALLSSVGCRKSH